MDKEDIIEEMYKMAIDNGKKLSAMEASLAVQIDLANKQQTQIDVLVKDVALLKAWTKEADVHSKDRAEHERISDLKTAHIEKDVAENKYKVDSVIADLTASVESIKADIEKVKADIAEIKASAGNKALRAWYWIGGIVGAAAMGAIITAVAQYWRG